MTEPTPDEARVERRTVTDSMRLRPAARRPGVPADIAGERAAGAIDALEARLAELRHNLERLHEPVEIGPRPLCRECLLPHPCATVRLARSSPEDPTPGEDSTQ